MKPAVVIGAGGHAAVVLSVLLSSGIDVIGVLDRDPALYGQKILGVEILGGDDLIARWPCQDIAVANGIGGANSLATRIAVHDRLREAGYTFQTLVHESAVISPECELMDGAQIMAGVVVQPRTRIGCNCIINTRASIDHDCVLDDHVHVAPGAVLAGGVSVGAGTTIGAGAIVIHDITIGAGAFVAAGATVTHDVASASRVGGTPARALAGREHNS